MAAQRDPKFSEVNDMSKYYFYRARIIKNADHSFETSSVWVAWEMKPDEAYEALRSYLANEWGGSVLVLAFNLIGMEG